MRSADEIAKLAALLADAYDQTRAGQMERRITLGAWSDALKWFCGAGEAPFGIGAPKDSREWAFAVDGDLGLVAYAPGSTKEEAAANAAAELARYQQEKPVEFCHIAVEVGAEGGPIYAFVRSFGFDEASSLEATLAAGREAAGRVQIDGADVSVELEAIPVSKQLAATLDALGGTEWHRASWFRLDGVAEIVPF